MDWQDAIPGLSTAAGGLASLFGGYKNPSDSAMPYLQGIPGQLQGVYNPYMNAGANATGQLQNTYGNLLNNPGGELNQIGSSFHASPGYQFQVQQGTNAVNNAAAAGGSLGSSDHQFNSASMTNGLANQDYYNYLNHAVDLFGKGLQGEQGLASNGLSASGMYGNGLMDTSMSQAQDAYAGQANANSHEGGEMGALFAGLGQAAPFLLGA